MEKTGLVQCIFSLATALFFAQATAAQNCSTPPQGTGEAWWQEFSAWCAACGGTPNPVDKTCSAGANWGRTITDVQSSPLPSATPPESVKPAPLTGQWTMTASCGADSESYAFNIDTVNDGVLTLSGGAWNCKLESGRIDGNRISFSCSNWLNKVDYQGTLVSDNFMQGSFTQRLRAEACQWSALKAGTTAPEMRGTGQAGAAATTGNVPAGGEVFVGTITKGNLAKGWGFSVINMKIFVAGPDGAEKMFYIREDSLITLADGTSTNVRRMSMSIKGKKVEIRYAPIRDATGGSPSGSGFSYEIGQNGVLALRFLE